MLPAENLDNKIKEFWPKDGPSTEEVEKYIKKYSKEKIVIKCGGRVLLDPALLNTLIDDIATLKKLGLKKGDVVYCSSNIGIFATTSLGFNKKKICKLIFDSIFKVIGTNGMLVVPTFTYSFCNNEIFDIKKNSL